MIRLSYSKISCWSCLPVRYSYVRKSQIDKISSKYGQTNMQKIKKYTNVFAHIAKEGFKSVRDDVSLYMILRQKPQNLYTSEDWNELIRLHHDFLRLLPLIIIQILPMSGPLFILYMYTYPGSIPSWFIVDKFHQDYEMRIRQVQKQAIQYFRQKQLKIQDVDIDLMSLDDAKRLSECLYGAYSDGTIGINKLFKKSYTYLINETFSKYFIKRKLKHKFRVDLQNRNILKNMTFEEKVKWKYNEVMLHGKILKNYEDTLTVQELKRRKEDQIAQKNMQSEGNQNAKGQK